MKRSRPSDQARAMELEAAHQVMLRCRAGDGLWRTVSEARLAKASWREILRRIDHASDALAA
jgi:hypothetical protein